MWVLITFEYASNLVGRHVGWLLTAITCPKFEAWQNDFWEKNIPAYLLKKLILFFVRRKDERDKRKESSIGWKGDPQCDNGTSLFLLWERTHDHNAITNTHNTTYNITLTHTSLSAGCIRTVKYLKYFIIIQQCVELHMTSGH